jgi:hypothetical protein
VVFLGRKPRRGLSLRFIPIAKRAINPIVSNLAFDYSSTTKTTPAMRSHTVPILASALLLRLLVLWFVIARFPHKWLYSRGIELGTLAQSLASGQGLSSPFGGSTGPTALLAPGYPVIIALFFRIFGSFTFATAIAVMAMQLLFSLLTVFFIMQVARESFGIRTANTSGMFWAVSLPLIWMPTIFLGNLLVHAAAGGHDGFGFA